jgi:hypothetical protein
VKVDAALEDTIVLPELTARLAERWQDQRILVQGSRGIRAELADHLFGVMAYEVAFLEKEISVLDPGVFTRTERGSAVLPRTRGGCSPSRGCPRLCLVS